MTADRTQNTASKSRCYYLAALRLGMTDDADLAEVAAILERARGLGNADASYALATWYLFGKHFKKNYKTAVLLLQEAASRGSLDALYDLAVCLEKGSGIKKILERRLNST